MNNTDNKNHVINAVINITGNNINDKPSSEKNPKNKADNTPSTCQYCNNSYKGNRGLNTHLRQCPKKKELETAQAIQAALNANVPLVSQTTIIQQPIENITVIELSITSRSDYFGLWMINYFKGDGVNLTVNQMEAIKSIWNELKKEEKDAIYDSMKKKFPPLQPMTLKGVIKSKIQPSLAEEVDYIPPIPQIKYEYKNVQINNRGKYKKMYVAVNEVPKISPKPIIYTLPDEKLEEKGRRGFLRAMGLSINSLLSYHVNSRARYELGCLWDTFDNSQKEPLCEKYKIYADLPY